MKRREIIGVSRTDNGLRPYIGERGGSLAEIATIAPNSKAATISTAHSPTIMEIAVLCGGKKGISGGKESHLPQHGNKNDATEPKPDFRAVLYARRTERAKEIRRNHGAERFADRSKYEPRPDRKSNALTTVLKDNLVLCCNSPDTRR